MSRPLGIQYPDAWYHVMNHGRRGEEVFEGKDGSKGEKTAKEEDYQLELMKL